jgi:hypothetical protein
MSCHVMSCHVVPSSPQRAGGEGGVWHVFTVDRMGEGGVWHVFHLMAHGVH